MESVTGFLIAVFSLISIPVFPQGQSLYQQICEQSKRESIIPIRPGKPGGQQFWNEKSVMFKYAPAFQNDNSSWIVPTAKYYRYSAFSFTDRQYYTFTAGTPYEPLTPVWDKLPDGEVYLRVDAVSADEKDAVLAGSRYFHKASVFCPPYPEARIPYYDAMMKGLRFMYNQQHIKNWYITGKPDHESHKLYCYSALEVGSVVNAMLLFNKYFPGNDSAMVIARRAADYIISNALPAGSPLEFFPMVYEGTDMYAGNFKEEIIMTEPAATGFMFLALYDRTGESKYLQAAVRIADTYLKTQLPSGTWYVRIKQDTGNPASEELCIPVNIVNFLSLLAGRYQSEKYRNSVNAAVEWIWENPMVTYNWTGQFEDVAAQRPYQNLTKYEASWFAQYLLKNPAKDSACIMQARELIAFCEDQFVVWNNPYINDNWGNSSQRWHTPAVLEQYKCYVPIDASAVQMINTFYQAYETTGELIYREKAIALANSVVNAQLANGMIPTFWVPGFQEFWNNCMVSSLNMLDRMSVAH